MANVIFLFVYFFCSPYLRPSRFLRTEFKICCSCSLLGLSVRTHSNAGSEFLPCLPRSLAIRQLIGNLVGGPPTTNSVGFGVTGRKKFVQFLHLTVRSQPGKLLPRRTENLGVFGSQSSSTLARGRPHPGAATVNQMVQMITAARQTANRTRKK